MSVSVLKARGLYTADNQLSSVPEGAMVTADNVVITYNNLLQSRRGQKKKTYTFGGSGDRANEIFFYDSRTITQYGGSSLTSTLAYGDNFFEDYTGDFTPPDATTLKSKAAEASENFYLTTSAGLKVLTSGTGDFAVAGTPRGWEFGDLHIHLQDDLFPASVFTGTSGDGWMQDDAQVAYKIVWLRKDENGNVVMGEPSGRTVITNPAPLAITTRTRTGTTVVATTASNHTFDLNDSVTIVGDITSGTAQPFHGGVYTITGVSANTFTYTDDGGGGNGTNAVAGQTVSQDGINVELAGTVPSNVDDTFWYRVYKTFTSAGADIPPDNYFFLVAENPSPGAALTAFTFTDTTPESFLDVSAIPLYTNDGEDDSSENAQPPICNDLVLWDNRLWGGNVTQKQRFFLTLLGLGSPDGLQDGDTITLDKTFTARTTFLGNPNEFQIYDNFGITENIAATARSLCHSICVNSDTTNAFYIADSGGGVGTILLEEKGLGAVAFGVLASRPSAWSPALTPTATALMQVSEGAHQANGLMYSKAFEPEHWPLLNEIPVGAENYRILRILPLRDKLFVFKEDGIFTVSGSSGAYYVRLLDNTARLLAPDTAQVCHNQIFALTNQGLVAVTDAGVVPVSRPIEDLVTVMLANPEKLAVVAQYSFGVSYEADRQYQLWMPSDISDTCATQCFVLNALTGVWTRWVLNRTCGKVDPLRDTLWMGHADANTLAQERKDYTIYDFADEATQVFITSASGTSVVLSSAADVAVGDALVQGSNRATVLELDEDTNTLTVESTLDWATNDYATAYRAIACAVKWVPVAAVPPGISKHFRETTLHFQRLTLNQLTMTFATDINPDTTSVPVNAPGFGGVPFGSALFGQTTGPKNRRIYVPKQKQRGTQLTFGFEITEAFADWTVTGFSLEVDGVSERTTYGNAT